MAAQAPCTLRGTLLPRTPFYGFTPGLQPRTAAAATAATARQRLRRRHRTAAGVQVAANAEQQQEQLGAQGGEGGDKQLR